MEQLLERVKVYRYAVLDGSELIHTTDNMDEALVYAHMHEYRQAQRNRLCICDIISTPYTVIRRKQ